MGPIGFLSIFIGPNQEDNSRLKECANIIEKTSNSSKHKQLQEEAQGQAQVQAQQREDSGIPLESWPRRIKKIGILLLMAGKPSFTCLKCHNSSVK